MITAKQFDIEADRELIEAGYYVLFSPDLLCVDYRNCPDFNSPKVQQNYKFIGAFDGEKLVGLCVVFNDYVLYPVMDGDYKKILTALILKAYEVNGNYLRAYTENELILNTAVDMGIGVTRNGYSLEFK